jgi:hypothetical protein
MKEYGCCPKFEMGDNSTYTFTKMGGGGYLVFLHAHLQVVNYNCVKFHKTPKNRFGRRSAYKGQTAYLAGPRIIKKKRSKGKEEFTSCCQLVLSVVDHSQF